eukprot:SAG31_NODE_805_length_11970_cov_3.710793_8_plen_104_part_00
MTRIGQKTGMSKNGMKVKTNDSEIALTVDHLSQYIARNTAQAASNRRAVSVAIFDHDFELALARHSFRLLFFPGATNGRTEIRAEGRCASCRNGRIGCDRTRT